MHYWNVAKSENKIEQYAFMAGLFVLYVIRNTSITQLYKRIKI